MSSRIDIQKRCKWCNAVFTAHKTTTEYCSHRCANLAYKDRVRKQRIESLQHELGKSIKTPPNLNKEYLTPSEVAELLNIGRTSIYRYISSANKRFPFKPDYFDYSIADIAIYRKYD